MKGIRENANAKTKRKEWLKPREKIFIKFFL